jgi:hypothetical protein
MALQAVIVTIMLLRWQILGRQMSLDAFEIACALDAPLLRTDNDFRAKTIREVMGPIFSLSEVVIIRHPRLRT